MLRRAGHPYAALARWSHENTARDCNRVVTEYGGAWSNAVLYWFLFGDREVEPRSPTVMEVPHSAEFGLGQHVMRSGYTSADSQVIFYAVYAVGGLPLLTLLCASAVTGAWWTVSRLTPGPMIVRVGLIGFGAVLSSPAWCLRPQVVTLTMCALTLSLLVRRRFLWWLPVLFLLWANMHGAVALGGVLVIAAWIAAAVHDRPALPPQSSPRC